MKPVNLHFLPISQIEPDPNQPRREMEAPDEMNEARTLAGLSESIRQYGILQPLRVRALDKHRFCIISGERRFKAALMANLTEVPAIIVETDQVLLEQLTENIQRKAMTPLELADAIRQLQRDGLAVRDIAKQLGLHPTQVTILSQLQTVSEEIRDAMREGLIVSPRAAYDMNRLPYRQQLRLIHEARKNHQTIGQKDVQNARRDVTDPPSPYAPTLMAKIEYNALMEILSQPIESEHYDPTADRLAIFRELETPADKEPVSVETITLSVGECRERPVNINPAIAGISSDGEGRHETREEPESSHQESVLPPHSPCPSPPLDKPPVLPVRIPSFTLKPVEFEKFADLLGEVPPPGLADPGGWLVNLIKSLARD
ncbi:MAG: ParB/RepB/Spo0J family partition protein [Pseudomonadota bacterium]